MSFSKAKIIRFNDITSVKPSPSNHKLLNDNSCGNYPSKMKKLCSTGKESPSNSDHGSVKSVPASFKTPTLPKKTKIATKTTPKDIFNTDLGALKQKTLECENKTKYIHKLSEELDELKKDLENLKAEKEQLQREHQSEIQDLEFEMLRTMTRLQQQEEEAAIKIKNIEDKLASDITNLKKAHEYKVGHLVLDCEIKLKDFREASDLKVKQEIKQVEEVWKEKLQAKEKEYEEILKECQAISEYNIIQCELEKKVIQKSLDEMTTTHESLQKRYDELQLQLNNFNKDYISEETNLNNKIKSLTKTIQEKEEEIKKLNTDIKAYQLTINNSQVTVEVLKNRLINSDKDVEQLKQELTRCEERLINYETRYLQLSTELKEAKDINEELEMQYESAIKLNECSIENIKRELLSKVNEYEEEVKRFTKKAKEEQLLKEQIMLQLDQNVDVIKQINIKLDETEKLYSMQINDFERTVENLKQDSHKYTNEIVQKEDQIKELEDRLHELQDKNEDLNVKCMYYKSKSEEFEVDAIESSQTRKNYIDLSGKYDILAHDFEILEKENKEYKNKMTSLSEKLERLMSIEDKFEKLKKEKALLENENLSYKNKLDEQKLKKYIFAAKDKENIGSPNRSSIDSTNRGSPFRERN